MADASTTYILDKIDNFVAKEWKLRRSMEGRIEELKRERKIITEILREADAVGEGGNDLKLRIQLLQELVSEIQIVVDMHAYKIANGNEIPWYDRWPRIRTHSMADTITAVETKLTDFKQKREGTYQLRSHPPSSSARHQAGIVPLYTPEREIVGVEGPRGELASWVLDVEHSYRAMFVVGMGGSGKTALVNLVFEQLKEDFDCHIWHHVSTFERRQDLLSTMYNKLCNRTGQSASASSPDLVEMLRNYLQNRRYLIVLDDWNREDWEYVKYAFSNPKGNISRVIVTTRRGDVAFSCCDNSTDIYRIQPSLPEKAEQLFLRKAFPESGDYPLVPDLREASARLLKACEGLPLGIIETGKFLSRKDRKESEFTELESSLRYELKLNSGGLSNITQVLMMSYNDLPSHLKRCFLYMSMFPENHPVNRQMLIRLWIAEDFIQGSDQKEPEDIGEEYLDKLMQRNLVQASEFELNGRPRSCRVHNLMHKILVSESEAVRFCYFAGHASEKVKRLSIQENSEFKVADKDLDHVHTLLSTSFNWKIPRDMIPSMKLLKILHLDHANLEAFPSGIKRLLLLKYLSLRSTRIKQVPISTERLKLLETLNVKDTLVTELPDSLVTLKNLRHLLAGRHTFIGHEVFESIQGVKVPKEISKLTNLQKLSYVRADKDLIQELQNLKKLRKLGIVDLPSNSGPFLCKAIEGLTSLRSLTLASEAWNQELDIQEMNKPPQLQRLYLRGRLEKMPEWISRLHELVRIQLKWSRLRATNNPITILGELKHLLELQLLDAYIGAQLQFCAGTFLKLKILDFSQMINLQSIVICDGALPCLQKLSISLCQNLRGIPTGIANITQLKELHLRDMPPGFVDPLKRNGPGRLLAPNIKIILWNFQQNGKWNHQEMSL